MLCCAELVARTKYTNTLATLLVCKCTRELINNSSVARLRAHIHSHIKHSTFVRIQSYTRAFPCERVIRKFHSTVAPTPLAMFALQCIIIAVVQHQHTHTHMTKHISHSHNTRVAIAGGSTFTVHTQHNTTHHTTTYAYSSASARSILRDDSDANGC